MKIRYLLVLIASLIGSHAYSDQDIRNGLPKVSGDANDLIVINYKDRDAKVEDTSPESKRFMLKPGEKAYWVADTPTDMVWKSSPDGKDFARFACFGLGRGCETINSGVLVTVCGGKPVSCSVNFRPGGEQIVKIITSAGDFGNAVWQFTDQSGIFDGKDGEKTKVFCSRMEQSDKMKNLYREAWNNPAADRKWLSSKWGNTQAEKDKSFSTLCPAVYSKWYGEMGLQ